MDSKTFQIPIGKPRLLEEIPEIHHRPKQCIVCGIEPVWAKLTLMGQIWYGLCNEHQGWSVGLTWGPQMFENARMPLIPPTLTKDRND